MSNVIFDRLMRITDWGSEPWPPGWCYPRSLRQATGTATVRGMVTDSSGGVLPGATVTVLNLGTKSVVTVVTDNRGGYLAGSSREPTTSSRALGVSDLRAEGHRHQP